jgi:hypothetical protein
MEKAKEKEQAYAEIMYMFRYFYRDVWAPGSIFNGKPRLWIQAFNDLVEQGFIKKRKKYPGYGYKWAGVWPEKY